MLAIDLIQFHPSGLAEDPWNELGYSWLIQAREANKSFIITVYFTSDCAIASTSLHFVWAARGLGWYLHWDSVVKGFLAFRWPADHRIPSNRLEMYRFAWFQLSPKHLFRYIRSLSTACCTKPQMWLVGHRGWLVGWWWDPVVHRGQILPTLMCSTAPCWELSEFATDFFFFLGYWGGEFEDAMIFWRLLQRVG